MNLTLAITTFNRPQMTIESFAKVLDDPRITEIIILDDHSEIDNWIELQNLMPKSNKIQLYSNPFNVGMAVNKMRAVKMCSNEWCIILDSDNVIDKNYLDALEQYHPLQLDKIYCPSFARPYFDYCQMQGELINAQLIQEFVDEKNFDQLLNTCNYVVHTETYLRNWKENKNIKECDTIWHNYNHLKNGGGLFIVPYMEYEHRVWKESGWMKNRTGNLKRFKQIKELIRQL